MSRTNATEAELDEYHRRAALGLDACLTRGEGYTALADHWRRELQLVDEVRRLRADSERLAYILDKGAITTDEDANLLLVVELQRTDDEYAAGDCGLTANEARAMNGANGQGILSGADALTRIIDAARQEPTPKREHILGCNEYHAHHAPDCCCDSCWCKQEPTL